MYLRALPFLLVALLASCATNLSSSQDAGSTATCGDQRCDLGERASCPLDCDETDRCGNNQCDLGETPERCAADCDCSLFCSNDGALHYCDESGGDASYQCPSALGSSCQDQGVAGCSCGDIPSTGRCYEDASIGVDLAFCEGGEAILYACGAGAYCDDTGDEAGCYCDNESDGICPDAVCTDDIDCNNCTPSCDAQGLVSECGSNGCGGSCGSCTPSQSCVTESTNGWQHCESSCTPDCSGKECGSDGCGGVCAPGCSGNDVCSAGTCESSIVGESISYQVSNSVSRNVNGQGNDPQTSVFCSMNQSTNTITIVTSAGDSSLEMIIESDPIGFCLFGTSDFSQYKFVDHAPADAVVYKIDALGNTSGLTLSCNASGTSATHLSATFSSGNLFKNGNSSVFPGDRVEISDGSIECDL